MRGYGVVIVALSLGLGCERASPAPPPAEAPVVVEARSAPLTLRRRCCKVCKKGKPCGDTCIEKADDCHQPPGCAC